MGEVRKLHARWCERHGIYPSAAVGELFTAMDIGDLACRMHPEGNAGDLALLADWSAWLLLRDDRWDAGEDLVEWERLAERDRVYLRLMRSGRTGEEPGSRRDGTRQDGLYTGLEDLCARLRRRAADNGLPDPVSAGFLTTMGTFFRGSVRQAFLQRRREVPDLKEYLELRRVTGGLDILTHVRAATDGFSLAGDALSGADARRLTLAADNICCWHNDLVSLNKELVGGEVNNLALVLVGDPASPCRTVEEGVEAVVGMIYSEQDEFARLGELLRRRGGPHARTTAWYVKMLEERISGVISWHEATVRYTHHRQSSGR